MIILIVIIVVIISIIPTITIVIVGAFGFGMFRFILGSSSRDPGLLATKASFHIGILRKLQVGSLGYIELL